MIDSADIARRELAEGVRLHQAGNPGEALAWYASALNRIPADPAILLPMGAALHDLERYNDALAAYLRMMELAPAPAALYHNLGNTLLALDRYEEAIESYAKALALMPTDAEALVTMGTALEQLGRYHEALRCYAEALKRRHDCAEAHWNLALALLRQGDFDQGWKEFEWRWRKKGYTSRWRDFGVPLWDGQPLNGRTILIHAEQAFGDTIQFVRYLPLVVNLGGRIILECPAPLATLLAAVPNLRQVIPTGTELPPFDCHIPLMSLPLIFRTTVTTIPAHIPYLSTPATHIHRWQEMVCASKGFRVGLVWAGRRRPDPHRSCNLADLAPLAQIQGITFFSIQVGEGAEQAAAPPAGLDLVDLSGRIADFADTAAIISHLHIVVTIDSAVAHLAGALGKPTLVLLPFASDWRWMLERGDSPWYPTMRIFRQQSSGCWGDPIKLLANTLSTLVQTA